MYILLNFWKHQELFRVTGHISFYVCMYVCMYVCIIIIIIINAINVTI